MSGGRGFCRLAFRNTTIAASQMREVLRSPNMADATPQVTPQVKTMLAAARQDASAEKLQSAVGMKDRVH